MRIVVTGAAGRLGAAVSAELRSAGYLVIALSRADLDITNAEQITTVMERLQPGAIVNCSAYNAVDAAETDKATAFAVNAQGPSHLARAARKSGALLVHFSTDFVFDGETSTPYVEGDATNPLSVYGASKAAGELEAATNPRHYILRVESLFGGIGVNGHRATVDFIAESLLTGQAVRAIADRTVTPSYVPDVVQAAKALIEGKAPFGTYHCVNSGCTTWLDLAKVLAQQVDCAACIEPVLSAHLKTVAPRPRFCALSNSKLRTAGISMPTWQSALRRHLTARLTIADAAHAAPAVLVPASPTKVSARSDL